MLARAAADIAAAAAACGVRKIRLTGGEPLVRRGIVELCRMLREIPGIEELCLTTNGVLLPALAAPLRAAGVDRLNISLDTLRPDRFRDITRVGSLADVLRGLSVSISLYSERTVQATKIQSSTRNPYLRIANVNSVSIKGGSPGWG